MPLELPGSFTSSPLCNGITIALGHSRGNLALANRTLKYFVSYAVISCSAVYIIYASIPSGQAALPHLRC